MRQFNRKEVLSKVWPHAVAIVVLYSITLLFFAPIIFEGKTLPQSDDISAIGMCKDAADLKAQDGVGAEWSNGMFSGMPTTTSIQQGSSISIYGYFANIIQGGLPYKTAGLLFGYMFAFYIFVICLGGNAWLALLGAIAYGLASYNIIIIDVGHVTKAAAMAYIAPLLMGVILTFRKKYMGGAILTMLALGTMISRYHIQIDYYAAIMVACVGLAFLVYYIIAALKREEQFTSFLKACGILIIAAILAILPSFNSLLPTYMYSKDTMRGGQQLSHVVEANKPSSGLDMDYAYAWSEGKMETFTHLIPNLYGGGHTILDKTDPAFKKLRQVGYGSTFLPTYWGDQPFTAGPLYAGAIVCWLFVLGLMVVKGPEKWWVVLACVFAILLSWGKNFLPFNEWMFHYLPMYNKFRTPSMALIIIGVAMPMLGVWGLHQIITKKIERQKALKYAYISVGITGGLCLLFILLAKTVFSFVGAGDGGFMQQLSGAGFSKDAVSRVMEILREYRCTMLVQDAWRSFALIILAFGVLWLYLKDKIKKDWLMCLLLTALVLFDMWGIGRRYLNETHFQSKKRGQEMVQKTSTDEYILQDPDVNYRVLNLSTNTFNESLTSYFHKSIGGYSPAKMRRYQDMIDVYLQPEMQTVMSTIYQTQGNLSAAPTKTPILNMLNCKYIIVPIQGGKTVPVENPYRLGNAWFVSDVQMVDNADEEFQTLAHINLNTQAVVNRQFATLIPTNSFTLDTEATIVNTLCKPNYLVYSTSSTKDQIAVFSEIYYDRDGWDKHTQDGWEVYVDGQEMPHFCANYILRAMVVPAGEHTIEFKFVPYTRLLGHRISNISSAIVFLLLLSLIIYDLYHHYHLQRGAVAGKNHA